MELGDVTSKKSVFPERMHNVLSISVSDERIFKAINSMVDFVFYSIFLKPIYSKRIVTILIEGETGSGKSMLSLALAEKLEEIHSKIINKDYYFSVADQVVVVPTNFSEKIDKWTTEKYCTLVVDELRFLVPKHKWQSLINQSIAETNAVIRAIKVKNTKYGGVIIYNTQDITDITKDVRKTINFDILIKRERGHVHAFVHQFYLKRRNIEKPTLKSMRARFIHRHTHFVVNDLVPVLPSTEVRREYEKISVEEKTRILRRKRSIIVNEIRKELGGTTALRDEIKNDQMFDMVKNLARWKRGKITFSAENKTLVCKLFNINRSQFNKIFMPAFEDEAKKRGLL